MSGMNTAKLWTAVACLSFGTAAVGQEPPPVETAAPEVPAQPAAAPAEQQALVEQESVDLGDDVSEVIVTARRIQERLQDVPISITVFNQDQLTERNVTNATEMATYTPSLSSNSRYGSQNASFAIRGFTQESRTTASVGVYFADVVAPRAATSITAGDGAGPGSFFDLANVQVLKGPQGTLFGRNTTGGAVLLVPQKPTGVFEGFVENKVGNYNLQQTTAVVNVPVSDSVRARFGIDRNTRDGYLDNVSDIGPRDFSDIGYTAYRASVVADLSENVENYTIGSYALSNTNGDLAKVVLCNPQRYPIGTLGCTQMERNRNAGFYTVDNVAANPLSRLETWQLINTTAWNASDTLTVKNIISYAELKNDYNADFYGIHFRGFDGSYTYTPAPTQANPNPSPVTPNWGTDAVGRPQDAGALIYGVLSSPLNNHTAHQSTFTEELQFQGTAVDGKMVWQAGAYYESSEGLSSVGSRTQSNIHCDDVFSLNCYDIIGRHLGRNVGNVTTGFGTIDFTNYGLYAQTTYDLTEKLKATGGIRYTNDKAVGDAAFYRTNFTGANFTTPTTYCNNPDSGYAVVPGAPNPPTDPDKQCRVHVTKKTDAPTWVLGLDYKPYQDLLLYGKWARGYRQGGVVPTGVFGATSYDEEQVDTYEIGSKLSFHGAIKGTFNVAAFYNDFTDQQFAVGYSNSQGAAPANAGIANAGSSEIYGVEVETVLIPARGLNIALSYAYLNTEIKEINAPAPTPPYDTVNLSATEGDPMPYTPENKVSAAITYTLPLDKKIGEISIGGVYTYQDSFFVAPASRSPIGTVDSRELVTLNANWMGIYGGPVDLGLFVTNLFDKEYYTTVTGGYASFGYDSAYVGEPRMYGARLRINFGG